MENEKAKLIRCRGIIIDEGEMLVVTHGNQDYFSLPGGRLEWGEDPVSCIKRELIEELGIEPTVGRLVYVNSFISGGVHTVEFIFEIENGKEYRDYENKVRTHAHELSGLKWITPISKERLLPEVLALDFKNGKLFEESPIFIT
jgi:ADP-ribose pyrophosphatase YjhB (NUDIX family)